MKPIYLTFIRIINIISVVLIGIVCIPAFILLVFSLPIPPHEWRMILNLFIPFLILFLFLRLRKIFNNTNALFSSSKIYYYLSFLSIIGFLIVIRYITVIPFAMDKTGYKLPVENYKVTANCGKYIKYFFIGGKGINLSVMNRSKAQWHFYTEPYPPHTIFFGGRDSGKDIIAYDDKTKRVKFNMYRIVKPLISKCILITSNILEERKDEMVTGKSEIISKSPNGQFVASAQSNKDIMEFVVKDSDQTILWKFEMRNCSTVIDWKEGSITWSYMSDIIFNYGPFDNTYISKFYLKTNPIYDSQNKMIVWDEYKEGNQ